MNKIIKFLLIFPLMAGNVFYSFSQTGSIRGFVYDAKTGEPLMFVNLILEGQPYGASTDVNGFFNITKVPVGKYTLLVRYMGYEEKKVPVSIKKNEIISKKIYLTPSSIKLKTVQISAEKQEMTTEVKASIVKIAPKQLKQLPTIGAAPDLAQYLQVLPGVVFTGDQGGQLYIRGGSPIQNKVILDGMTIYNPFHSIGLFSVIDADIIRNVDVYTGGFGAEYGDRISSIMDITMRDGNKKKFGGKITTSTFGAKAMLEGPIVRDNDNNKASISYILSAKTSYLEQSSKMLYTYIDTGGLPFNYTDLYGKITINAGSGNKISVFGFNYSDRVNYGALTNLNWKESGLGSSFVILPSSANALIKGHFSVSNYNISLKDVDNYPRESSIGGFNLSMQYKYFLGPDQFDYGFDIQGFKTNFVFYNVLGIAVIQEENTTELGFFMKYKANIKKLIIEPSFRLQYYASLSEMSPEPRLGLKYKLNERLRLKTALGMYSQNLISATSDRDVVNLFYGFLSGPENLPASFDGKQVTSKLQKAKHLVLGFEYDLTQKIMINIEGYYKHFDQLTNINRDKIYEDNENNADIPDNLKKDFIIENGNAYGVDFLTKYDYDRLYIWLVYSLGFSHRYDGIIEYVPHFDRRHNVNFITTYRLGEIKNWEISLRWNFGSGFPFTQTQGIFEQLTFNSITTNYVSENGQLGFIYGELNGERLPDYHRLDFTLKHWIEFVNMSRLEFVFTITNVYNRKNIFYFDRIGHKVVYQLPFMPSFGLSYKF